ncbi:ATP-binding protein [Amycolatopsis eburnea]|uniref:LuxR family transcriptional regulator n=1 Tax=Amycolatopsis eburnea TaxID=2267691 RepID=A0A427T8I0_9PSEU|nr:LuxR family transcriptional regulator [Amycolatopsis eburnea]RSD17098.1 LuxR family transcriptional regulator [Amycolatopsis eburnea]
MAVRSGVRASARPELAGRDWELRVLTDRARAAALGEGQAVLLRGPAGIGKTGLLAAALDGLDGTVLTVTCADTGAGAYEAVRALFGPLWPRGDAGEAGQLAGSARLALPALAPGRGDGTADTYSVMHGLYWLVAGLAARGPVVLAVDDAQWCDETSLRWLGFLLRRAEDLPVLVLLTQRTGSDGPGPAVLAELGTAANCLAVDLAPLTADAVADVLAAGFGTAPDPEFARHAAEITGGNPFLLDRVVGALRGRVPPDAGHVGELDELGREAVVRPLLDRLSPDALAVARAIAVLGGEELETIAALAGTRPGPARHAVQALRDGELLEPDRLDYAHDLIRAAALNTAEPAELARLRERAATLLNDSGRSSEEVAVHLLVLDGPPQPWMVTVLREAAAAAESRGAPTAAARYLTQVLRAHADDVAVLVHLSRVLGQTDPAASLRHLEHALGLVADPRRRVPIVMQYVMVSLGAQNSRRSYALATEVADALEAVIGPAPSPADRALRMVGQSALLLSGLDEKATVSRVGARLRDVVPPPGDTAEERELLGMLSSLGTLQGRPAGEVVAQAAQVLRIGDVAPGGWAVLGAVLTLYLADRPEPALAALGGVLDHAQRRGQGWTYVLGATTRALVHQFCGNLTDALADAQYAFDVITQERWAPGTAMPQTVLASLLVRQGDPAGAEAALAAIVRPRLEHFTLEYHWYLIAKARARAASGDVEGALAVLRTCGESLAGNGIGNPVLAPWWYESAELLGGLGRRAEGEAVLDDVEPAVRRWGTNRALGMLQTSRGVLADGDAAIERLREAAELLADSPAKVEQAKAEYLLGRRLLARGDAEGARERLRRSIDLSVLSRDKQQLGLSLPALAEAGGRMRHGTDSPSDALSGSERRVAERAAEGATNREIAESLFITQRTVEVHLTSVYRKLGIGGRAELAAALRDH